MKTLIVSLCSFLLLCSPALLLSEEGFNGQPSYGAWQRNNLKAQRKSTQTNNASTQGIKFTPIIIPAEEARKRNINVLSDKKEAINRLLEDTISNQEALADKIENYRSGSGKSLRAMQDLYRTNAAQISNLQSLAAGQRPMASFTRHENSLNSVTSEDDGQGGYHRAKSKAINARTGEFLTPAGKGYVGTRDGTYYAPAGPHGVINTRNGQFIPMP